MQLTAIQPTLRAIHPPATDVSGRVVNTSIAVCGDAVKVSCTMSTPPATNDTEQLTVRVSRRTLDKLEIIAPAAGLPSRATVARQMLELVQDMDPDRYLAAIAAFKSAGGRAA